MSDMYDTYPEDDDLRAAMEDAMGGHPSPEDFMDDMEEPNDEQIMISREKHDAILRLLEVLVRSHENLTKKVSDQGKEISKLKGK